MPLFPCQVVSPREDGVAAEHAGAGVAHHRPDLLPHVRFIAVHGALRAFRLVVPERTFVEALGDIGEEFSTLRAQALRSVMVAMAEDLDHCFDGPAFLFHAPLSPIFYKHFRISPLVLRITFSIGMSLPAAFIPFSTIRGSPEQHGTSMITVVTLLISAVLKISVNLSI